MSPTSSRSPSESSRPWWTVRPAASSRRRATEPVPSSRATTAASTPSASMRNAIDPGRTANASPCRLGTA
ncbi:hypothetical protein [Streptomyces sp. NPDC050982]|uniref:hypothetical protein n=1 Tax=Streptomyces sp. NPDC050982 TaxID=3154746 RepID=UPI0033F424C0